MIRAIKVWLIVLGFFLLSFIAWITIAIVRECKVDIDCKQHVRMAADASTVELAEEQLGIIIDYIEENGLTEGNTSIFIQQPKNDLGFWYKNTKSAYEDLKNLPGNATTLEKSNALMKLRESLIDDSTPTVPKNLAFYPYQAGLFIWFIVSLLGIIICAIVLLLTEWYY